MKLRIFGLLVMLAVVGTWVWTFHLAFRWEEYLQRVNNDPFGYWYIGGMPFLIPVIVTALVGLWFLAPMIGEAVVDWLRK